LAIPAISLIFEASVSSLPSVLVWPPAELLRPYPAKDMTAFPVSTAVNSPKNDRAGLIEPLQANT